MTRVRALDVNHDWTFGKGRNNYLRDQAAVMQSIDTRLSCFLGDCFFDLGAGIDWYTYLGSKDQLPLALAIQATIQNTAYVTGTVQTRVFLTSARAFNVQYTVQTTYSRATGVFGFNTSVFE